ncbi:sugar-transfer associated ATP-grasp domain-containing protein [Lentzea sp. NPDC092896]|uniref:sugar-transfer associated ATP-grasp domain-containing protein n=1 Tax=Lentzea sp. NPDC092896 TaxID=3364127 RepID=UPI0037F99CB6
MPKYGPPTTDPPPPLPSADLIEDVVAIAQRCHDLVPCLETVGWDIADARQGPTLLEGNHDWDVVLPQRLRGVGLRHLFRRATAGRYPPYSRWKEQRGT